MANIDFYWKIIRKVSHKHRVGFLLVVHHRVAMKLSPHWSCDVLSQTCCEQKQSNGSLGDAISTKHLGDSGEVGIS